MNPDTLESKIYDLMKFQKLHYAQAMIDIDVNAEVFINTECTILDAPVFVYSVVVPSAVFVGAVRNWSHQRGRPHG